MSETIVRVFNIIVEVLKKDGYTKEFVSSFLAMLSGVMVVFFTDVLRNKFITPRNEFSKLRMKVYGMLDFYSRDFCNTIDSGSVSEEIIHEYCEGSNEIRKLAVECSAFAAEYAGKSFRGVTSKDLMEISRHLMQLSNSFFTPYKKPEDSFVRNKHNEELKNEIKKKLKLSTKTIDKNY